MKSKPLTGSHYFDQSRSYSTDSKDSIKDLKQRDFELGGGQLHPWWVTGIVDGEGMFFISVQKTNSALGHKISFEFKVTQKTHSAGILYDLQRFFGCGTVVLDNRKDNTLKFHITNLDDIINKVLPHFEAYPLVTSKMLNYLDFKLVAEMKVEEAHKSVDGINKIIAIKQHMNKEHTYDQKWNYLLSQQPIVLDPNWVSAFVDGEGSFYIELVDRGANTRTNTYVACYGQLSIAQNSHDILVLDALKQFFDKLGGKSTLKPKYDITNIVEAKSVRSVGRFSLKQHDVVIEFIDRYPLLTRKALDYQDWKTIMKMYENKLHLTPNGRATIEALKRGMNTGRSNKS